MVLRQFIILYLSFLADALQNSYCQLSCEFYNESLTHTVCDRGEQNGSIQGLGQLRDHGSWVWAAYYPTFRPRLHEACSGIFTLRDSNTVCVRIPKDARAIEGETLFGTSIDKICRKCGPDSSCGSDFMVVDLNDDDRQYILDIHNYLRNKVALGYERRTNQPKAANMRTMSYNRELEFIAQCWANTCNGNPLIHDRCRRTAAYDYVGQNLGYINGTSPKINKVQLIKDITLLWYDEVTVFNNTWVNYTETRTPDYVVGHYTQLIWAETTDIGCAFSYYSSNISDIIWYQSVFVCNYGPGGNYLGEPLYNIGEPASECPEGLERNSFYKGLCGKSESAEKSANFTFGTWEL